MRNRPWHALETLDRRQSWAALAVILAVALAVRLLALLVLREPMLSDSAAYFAMAKTLMAHGGMRDIYGNAAFYSPGYPVLLGLVFLFAGASLDIALLVNLVLGLASTWLVYALARRASGSITASLFAGAGFALLIAAVAGTAYLQRENLSVPLLLLFVLASVALLDTARPLLWSAVAGLAYGTGVLAGASVLLTAAIVPLALYWRGGVRAMTGPLAVFAGATLIVLTPWLMHVDRVLGRPVLTTNGPFNLYIGNNPAANGRFVSMRDTPMGPQWQRLHREAGELAATDRLGELAIEHIRAHPLDTTGLAALKLGLFWLPDPPDPQDANGTAVTLLRWLDALQHLFIVAAAGAGALLWRRRTRGERLILLAVAAFWTIHAAAYVMPRYRQPAMPLLLVVAASTLAPLASRRPAAQTRIALV